MNRITTILMTIVMVLPFVFTACNKTNPNEANIRKHIVGKWKTSTFDGKNIPTDEESVWTFYDDGTATISYSSADGIWDRKEACDYKVYENSLTVTKKSDGDVVTREVREISKSKVAFGNTASILHPEMCTSKITEYKKVGNDYSEDIIGLWQGVSSEGEETHGDENHRWEYREDGTYTYYVKENDWWVPSDNTFNVYVVDGDWLATRWIDKDDVEFREWWDIETCNETQMTWKAVRQKDDGTQYVARFEMRRVK